MSTPDVRVRLSPEGIREVIAGLRQVQAESNKSSKSSAAGVGVLRSALSDLKSLLPTIGLAAAVAGMIGLGKQALQTADATGKLQVRFGGAVEEISGLNLAFRTNESSQQGLQQAFTKTAELLGKLRSGSKETREDLEAIGVDTVALQGQSTPRALETIAKNLSEIPPGAERAAAAARIFGRTLGQELLPALDAVGEQGIDAFIEKAREMGVLIDEDLADAAARANDALGIIKIQAEGLATQFTAGLAPQIAGAMEDFSAAIQGDGFNAVQKFAEGVGFFIRFIVGEFIVLGKIIGANVAAIGVLGGAVADAVSAAARLDFSGAKRSFTDAFKTLSEMSEQLEIEKAEIRERVATPAERRERAAPGSGRDVDFEKAQLAKIEAARLAARKSGLDAELKLQQEALKAEEQANKIAYDQGLQSLEAFFAKRRDIVARQTQAEVAALRIERQGVAGQLQKTTAPEDEAERIKLRQELAALTAQIQAKELEGQRELAALDAERTAGLKDLKDEQRRAATELDELEGNRHAAFLRNLEGEIEQIRLLGARAGQTAEQINAQVDRLTRARTAQFDFDEVRRRGTAALQAFDRDAQQIQRDQEAGIITQLEGEERLIALQRQRLQVLRQLADEQLRAAEATGNDELIEQARSYSDSVAQIQSSFEGATNATAQFRQGAAQSFQTGLGDLFANVDKIKSFEDALGSLADTVARELARIAGEILARQATLALLNSFFGVPSTGATPATGQTGGAVQGLAEGDVVAGPKLPIAGPDKIPALLEEGEFVVRKRSAQRPGALAFLRAFNAGAVNPLRVRRFADGGLVGRAAQALPAGASRNRLLQMNVSVQADRQGQVSRQTLNQTSAAVARGLQEANRRDN